MVFFSGPVSRHCIYLTRSHALYVVFIMVYTEVCWYLSVCDVPPEMKGTTQEKIKTAFNKFVVSTKVSITTYM